MRTQLRARIVDAEVRKRRGRALAGESSDERGEQAIQEVRERLVVEQGRAAAARASVIVERNGIRYGFLQRSSVYWPTNHEAGANSAGIAVIRAHTAYQVPMHKTRPEIPPMNRPGIPPVIITWADPDYLRDFTDDIAALRTQADIVVHHATGACTRRFLLICTKSAAPRSMPAPIS